jgi:hypothetical protein
MGTGGVHVSEASLGHLRRLLDEAGSLVVGRRLYDVTHGWGGGSRSSPRWRVTR